ncbi:DUF3089 domain-containing protein [Patulibacter sp.]|uniref:DUF3089 domain-containing protein n=1 Tax=Patulibacter sp. TaxID=1912859 RepID=UPI002717FEDB|nr:DUF3089 domain-containing protein [Patulibacter sp.]MDO9408045.1 DUF3089 domain-containing protein [Patulibacter sp.]
MLRPRLRLLLRAAGLLLALLTAGPVLVAPAPASAAEPTWVCRPGMPGDVCTEGLDTTVLGTDGSSRVEPAAPDPAAPIDCFYVYPTVSNQLGPMATGDADPEVQGMARLQAQRFAQRCRVYAPLYRQGTVPGIFLGGFTDATRQAAYSDVLAAWRSYLAKDNRGRGVVLIGHSQGTGILRRLIREEIDPVPEVRSRLVSAILLGGNVLVKKGSDRGGDFADVPLCRADGQFGCVVAFSTFDETPQDATRFGKPPTTTDRLTGLAPRSDVEVACTNPASLAANRDADLTTLMPTRPYPAGFIALGLTATYLGVVPTAATPWVQPADRYAGRCETVNGSNVLMLRRLPGARDLLQFPDAGWGLHILDGNIALGDLLRVVATQTKAFESARATAAATPAATGRPRVALRTTGRTRRDARGRRCVSGRLTVRVAGADRRDAIRADFRLNRRTVARDRRSPLLTRIAAARLRTGQNRVDALVRLGDGRSRRVAATVRGC